MKPIRWLGRIGSMLLASYDGPLKLWFAERGIRGTRGERYDVSVVQR